MFFTKLLTLDILFSTGVSAEFVAKPLILGFLFSILLFLILQSIFLTSILVSGFFCLHHYFFLNPIFLSHI